VIEPLPDIDQSQEPPRNSVVEVYGDDTLQVVVGRIAGMLQTDLVLRPLIPDDPDVESVATRVDQRYCLIVALPARPGGKVQ
jgi:hypothetical protein